MRICIIGSSGHVNYVLEGIMREKVDIVGLAPGSKGEDIGRLITEINSLGYTPKKYKDFNKMLDELKPDIAVVNCYFGDNVNVSLAALQRNIHVFTEKPIATTFEELELLRKTYEKKDVFLAAMFGLRYQPWFLTAKKTINEGAIGKVRLMNAQKSYKLGLRPEFYKNRDTYGGTIPWVGSHAIDWLYWFSNERFKSVYASHSTNYNNGHGELESTALCHFIFSNQVFGSVSIDYLRPQEAPGHDDDRLRIVGTEGIIEVINNKVFLINKEIKGKRELALQPKEDIFSDFLRQIRGAVTCKVSADDSFLVTEACLKARQSADEGRIIYFDDK